MPVRDSFVNDRVDVSVTGSLSENEFRVSVEDPESDGRERERVLDRSSVPVRVPLV